MIKFKKFYFLIGIGMTFNFSAVSGTNSCINGIPLSSILHQQTKGSFQIAAEGKSADIIVDPEDWYGVIRAAKDLGSDIGKVTGVSSKIIESIQLKKKSIVIGTIGKSKLIDRMVSEKKINVSALAGKWESFMIQTVDGNLIIAGSDKRGTIYGIYDISEKIGVSPWYWWADVPPQKSSLLYIKNMRYIQPSPKVKYRGIFINDEEPSFGQWAQAKFGGVNSKMYATMFELLLRLKANFLWPAMWGKAFNEDDPLSPIVADAYGIVMGTSHHEPMMRAQKEYSKRQKDIGPWDYKSNKVNLDKYFYDGVNRNKLYDNVITIGMRGDGDVAMGNGNDNENINTLRDVIKGQRNIIQKAYGKDPAQVPQLWAIFTEVQRYYDKGLNVPDDVTLVFCDNNWGYIRRTGPEKEQHRSGGMGLYYHIDMNGGPWNDRWINTTTVPKLREQLSLAYQTGIKNLWVINVGDLKPKELPIDFIMHLAWNPDAIPPERCTDYIVNWATQNFGKAHASEIAEIVSQYPKYNLWRKPEVQSTNIYSIVNYNEADKVLALWQNLSEKAEQLGKKIKPEAQDAYYQLVLYPTKASAGVAELWIDAAKNNLYARQGRVTANEYADRVIRLFKQDSLMSNYYNTQMSNGKWKNMMQDVHIGYTKWFMPRVNKLPTLVKITPLENPTMGVAIDGSEQFWPGSNSKAELPVFDSLIDHPSYIDVFNKGTGSFKFTVIASDAWVKLSIPSNNVYKENRITVNVDWKKLPIGKSKSTIYIKKGETTVPIEVIAVKSITPKISASFFGNMSNQEFSIPAYKFNANIPGKNAKWISFPNLGRGNACMGIQPVTAPSVTPKDAPRMEYNVLLSNIGKNTICLGILPTQDVNPRRGLRIAVSLDDDEPQILDARKGYVDTFDEYTDKNLSNSDVLKPLPKLNDNLKLSGKGNPMRNDVFDNLRWLDAEFTIKEAGIHRLKIYMIDPEIVLENIIINPDNDHPSYFGAPCYSGVYEKIRN